MLNKIRQVSLIPELRFPSKRYAGFHYSGFMVYFAPVYSAYRFPQLNIKTDVSYAVYVYHMVVVNVFIALGLVQNIVYLALVFVITIAIGYASTKTIGAFGLKKKTE